MENEQEKYYYELLNLVCAIESVIDLMALEDNHCLDEYAFLTNALEDANKVLFESENNEHN